MRRRTENPAADPGVPHWADIAESTALWGIWLLFGVYRLLGRWPFRVCLYPVVLYYWASRPVARRASMEYLQRLHQSQYASGRPPGWDASVRHFIAFAEGILDKLLALTGRLEPGSLHAVGEEGLLELKQQGRGAVIATAHVGCMELCRLSAERQGPVRLNVLVHTQHAARFNRLLQRLQPENSVTFIPVTEVSPATAMLLADKVAAGEFVVIAADRVPVRHSTCARARFLGREANWPVGAYVLAALLKCPLFAMVCVREEGRYTLRVERLGEQVVLPRGGRERALAEHAQGFANWLETVVARAPLAWFNFFPFWEQAVPHAADGGPSDAT